MEIETWTSIAALIVAVCALGVSAVSLYFSWQAEYRANAQENRRAPRLIVHLLNGYARSTGTGERLYCVHISISNPTDADNAISFVELRVDYRTATGLSATLKLPLAHDQGAFRFKRPQNNLSIPCKVAARDTIAGWCYFTAVAELLDGACEDAYSLEALDTYRNRVSVDILLMQELRDDTENTSSDADPQE